MSQTVPFHQSAIPSVCSPTDGPLFFPGGFRLFSSFFISFFHPFFFLFLSFLSFIHFFILLRQTCHRHCHRHRPWARASGSVRETGLKQTDRPGAGSCWKSESNRARRCHSLCPVGQFCFISRVVCPSSRSERARRSATEVGGDGADHCSSLAVRGWVVGQCR